MSTSGDIFRYSTPEGYDGEWKPRIPMESQEAPYQFSPRFQMEAWGNSSGQPMGIDFDRQARPDQEHRNAELRI